MGKWGIFVFMPYLSMLGQVLIVIIILGAIIKLLKNRNVKLVKDIDMTLNYREIPCFKKIKVAYWLLYNFSSCDKSELNNGLVGAYLLSWYKNGYIDVNITNRSRIFKNDYSINLKSGDWTKDNSEACLYSFLKRAAKTNNILEKNEIKEYCSIDSNRVELRVVFEYILKEAQEYLEKNNLLTVVPAKDFILFKTNPKYTLSKELLNEYQNLIGLKNFLLDYSNMEEKKHIEVHLWEDYLIFANLFGIADKVKEQFSKIYSNTTLSNLFEPSFDDSLVGRLGLIYKISKLQLVSYIAILVFMLFVFWGNSSIAKMIPIVLLVIMMGAFIYIPLKKYLMNKKVKEMYGTTEAKIIDYTAHQHEDYDSETGKYVTTTSYSFNYEFYINEIRYTGTGYSRGFFVPRKGKGVKIYFNQDDPSKNETKAKHNYYLNIVLSIVITITIALIIVKFVTT